MYYEIYIDSLFLLNFTMNLYLLLLVDKSLHRTATRIRLLAGAVLGGAGYCLMFLIPFGNAAVKILSAAIPLNGGILFWVFRPHSAKAFFRILERMCLYCFLMGGGLTLLINHVKPFRRNLMSVSAILAGASILLLVFSKCTEARATKKELCKVVLSGTHGCRVTVQAIIDTGNCLKEPISGKPVSVVEKAVFDRLWKKEPPEGFRAIPYRSVGCERGIMKGYEIPEVVIEQDGMRKVCLNVYVGVSERAVSSTEKYRMLVHPELLER